MRFLILTAEGIMNYLYDDEDNQPMHEENILNDRDCPNCKHKVNGECQVWDCRFEPKGGEN